MWIIFVTYRRIRMRFFQSFVVMAVLLVLPCMAAAQQLFVTDVQEITVRSGTSLDSKVVQLLKSGSKMEKLKEEGDWINVRTETGKEGWVLKRYSTAETPIKVKFEEFKAKNADLVEKADKVDAVIGKYEEENKNLRKTLATLQGDNAKIKQDFDALTQANANVADLAKKYQELKASVEAGKSDADKLMRENEMLRDLSDVKWFVAGGGVFFLGWVFGYLLGRSSKKKANRMYL